MTQPTLPPEVEAQLVAFAKSMDAVVTRIHNEQATLAANWHYVREPVRVQRLREMELHVKELTARAESIMRENLSGIQVAYEHGAWSTALKAGSAIAFTAADAQAVAVLARDTMGDLLAATQHVRDSTKVVVQMLTKDWVTDKLVTGLTAVDAGKKLADAMATAGLATITYANGRAVPLNVYSEMVMRTKTAVAYQQGGFEQGRILGIDWWEIMDGPTCGLTYHDDPTLADGMIVERDMAEMYPISHPNCVRVTSPRPDITSAKEAWDAKRTSPEEQVADQKAAAEARAAAKARTARTRATRGPKPPRTPTTPATPIAPVSADPFANLPVMAPSSITDAAAGANPGLGQREYTNNCMLASQAVEMRARGFDVFARAIAGNVGQTESEFGLGWVTPDGRAPTFSWLRLETGKTQSKAALKAFTADMPDGARGVLSGAWKGGGHTGHIFNWEKIDGKLIFVDGQHPTADAAAYFSRMQYSSMRVLRTDTLTPTPDLLRLAVEGNTSEARAALELLRGTTELDGFTARIAAVEARIDEVKTLRSKVETELFVPANRLDPERMFHLNVDKRQLQATEDWLRSSAATLRANRETAMRLAAAAEPPPEVVAKDLAKKIYTSAVKAEPKATAKMQALASQHGARLEGLDFRLKTEESLARKIANDAREGGISLQRSADEIRDAVRYTMIVEPDKYASTVEAAVKSLHDEGWQIKVKNYWVDPSNPYQGINVQLIDPTGQRVELQFHTEASFYVKEKEAHAIYEKLRVSRDAAERAKYDDEMRAIFAKIPVPPAVRDIASGTR